MLLSGRFAVPADASDAMLLAKQSSASNRAPRAPGEGRDRRFAHA